MGAGEMNFYEFQNIFDIGCDTDLPGASVEKIPIVSITSDNNFDACGNRVSCSVCLEVDLSLLTYAIIFLYDWNLHHPLKMREKII